MQKIAWLVITGCISFCGLPASASMFGDCKDVALAHYVAAWTSVSPTSMRNAVDESTACDRFLLELPQQTRGASLQKAGAD
jgi:hypothetical protein